MDQEPSIIKKVQNLSESIIEHMLDGMKSSKQTEQERRLEICNGCEFFSKENSRCGKCGCNMLIKTKWNSSRCPKNYW